MTLNITSYIKQPWEEETIQVGFSKILASGDNIQSATISIWDGDTEITSTMIGATSISSPYVLVKIKGGDSGKNYNLRVRVTTSNGEKYEEDLVVRIRQIGA